MNYQQNLSFISLFKIKHQKPKTTRKKLKITKCAKRTTTNTSPPPPSQISYCLIF